MSGLLEQLIPFFNLFFSDVFSDEHFHIGTHPKEAIMRVLFISLALKK